MSGRRQRPFVLPGRSLAVRGAVCSWWLCAVCVVVAWIGLGAESGRANLIGMISAGLGLVLGLAATVAGVIALFRDRGRIRAGAIVLLLVAVSAAVFVGYLTNSTVYHSVDPGIALWVIISSALLILGTLLVIAPGSDI